MSKKEDKIKKRIKHRMQKAAREAAAVNVSIAEPDDFFPQELSPAWQEFYRLIARELN